jgi:rubrerythrin
MTPSPPALPPKTHGTLHRQEFVVPSWWPEAHRKQQLFLAAIGSPVVLRVFECFHCGRIREPIPKSARCPSCAGQRLKEKTK